MGDDWLGEGKDMNDRDEILINWIIGDWDWV